jgi:putative solute:sodium symporter small subunit
MSEHFRGSDVEQQAVPAPPAARRAVGYWRANLRLQLALLVIWAVVGYLLSIILAEPLNEITIGGFPLGYWFAQQGAIYVFVILIFVYALRMDRVDRDYDVHEEELGVARKRVERRMQKELTGEAPAAEAEFGEPTGEETREKEEL